MATINVTVRIRPISTLEILRSPTKSKSTPSKATKPATYGCISTLPPAPPATTTTSLSLVGSCDEATSSVLRTYEFDAILSPLTDNQGLYNSNPKAIIAAVKKYAIDGTIFFYGQTGAGKSYSCFGDILAPNSATREARPATDGVIVHALRDLYEGEVEGGSKVVNRSVTFYEIFQERVHDLLLPPAANGGGAAKRTSLPVRTHPTKGSYIEGITTVDITSSLKVALTTIKKGFKSRATAGTEMNEQSSRSHAVVRITTTHEDKSVSHVTFVDLAGSERQRKTQTSGERLKEASAINQSLSTLGGVIYALGINSNADDDNQRHVPYRDSKLTLLLKSSLSVTNCKTTMVMNVSPCGSQFAETLSTLKFAQRVKLIKADPTAKARFSVTVNTEEERLRKEVNQLRMEIDRLKIEPGSLLTPPSTAGTTLFPPLPPAALSLDTAKEEALVAALARLEVAESGFEALTETHTRYKLQSQMVYKLKQSRIEALSSRLSEGKPMTDGDDDLSVLCGEIDELRKQLDSPDFEAVKYKVLLDAANATTPAFSASSLTNLLKVVTEEKRDAVDEIGRLRKESSTALAAARSSTMATSNSLQRKLKEMKDRAEDAEEDLQMARDVAVEKEEIASTLKINASAAEQQRSKLEHDLEQAKLTSKHQDEKIAKIKLSLEEAQKQTVESLEQKAKTEAEYSEKISALENDLFAAAEEAGSEEQALLKAKNAEIQNQSDKIRELEAGFAAKEAEFGKERADWESKWSEQASLDKQRIDSLEAELGRARMNADKWERVAEETERREAQTSEELRKVKKKRDDDAFERENLQEDYDTMTEQVKYYQMQNEELESEVRRLGSLCGMEEQQEDMGDFDCDQEDSELVDDVDATDFEAELARGEDLLERERQLMVLETAADSAKNSVLVEKSLNESAFFPNHEKSVVYDVDADLFEEEGDEEENEAYFTPAKGSGHGDGGMFLSPAPLSQRDVNVE